MVTEKRYRADKAAPCPGLSRTLRKSEAQKVKISVSSSSPPPFHLSAMNQFSVQALFFLLPIKHAPFLDQRYEKKVGKIPTKASSCWSKGKETETEHEKRTGK